MAGYQIYEKVGGQLVPINLTTEERLSQVEQSCLDYHNNGLKRTDNASETERGAMRLATDAEVIAGTLYDVGTSPKGVKAVISAFKADILAAFDKSLAK